MSEKLTSLTIDDTHYETRYTTKFECRKQYHAPDPKQIMSFLPGVIVEIPVKIGQKVKWGDTVMFLEAMKMKNAVTAPNDGTIKSIAVQVGDKVQKLQLLLEFE